MSHLTIAYSTVLGKNEIQVFTQEGMKQTEMERFLQLLPEKTDIYANPYSSSKTLQFSPMGGGVEGEHCKMQKISSKDLPESPSLSASHPLWKSKNFTWICVMQCKRLHVKC